jgi:hypothetical protein
MVKDDVDDGKQEEEEQRTLHFYSFSVPVRFAALRCG